MSVDKMQLSSQRSSFYGEASESSNYSRISACGPSGSGSKRKRKRVPEAETPLKCKSNGNRNGDDPVELHSRNRAYLCFQKKEILRRWLKQNGIAFSDQWPKAKIADLVSGNYRISISTPKPKRCGQWKRSNRTMPQLRRKGNRKIKSRLNSKRSVSAPLNSSFVGMSHESQDEIHENEEDDDDLMKGIDFSGIPVRAEEKVEMEDEEKLMDEAMKMI